MPVTDYFEIFHTCCFAVEPPTKASSTYWSLVYGYSYVILNCLILSILEGLDCNTAVFQTFPGIRSSKSCSFHQRIHCVFQMLRAPVHWYTCRNQKVHIASLQRRKVAMYREKRLMSHSGSVCVSSQMKGFHHRSVLNMLR